MGPWFPEDVLRMLRAIWLAIQLSGPGPGSGVAPAEARAYRAGQFAALTAVAAAFGIPLLVQEARQDASR